MSQIILYTHELLSGNPCYVHEDFVPSMDIFCDCLADNGCKALITSSQRKTTIVPGAIVKPAKMSNHLVGHAVDGNVYDYKGHLWNHKELANPTGEVLAFILDTEAKGLRWGGRFKKPDTVHWDTALNLKNPKRWKEIYAELTAVAL